ncbi:MAG: hypothetical protein RIC35_25245 [Marinoscillum sp.]
MSLTKTIGTLIATALVGSVTLLVASPKKIQKNKTRTAKTSMQNGIAEKDDLFI